MSLLSTFFNIDVVENDDFKYSPSGLYYAPQGEYTDFVNYIKSLPIDPLPEVTVRKVSMKIKVWKNQTAEKFLQK